jgi:hypothetical protein
MIFPFQPSCKQFNANGYDQLAELIRIIVNADMQAEHQLYLGAEPT